MDVIKILINWRIKMNETQNKHLILLLMNKSYPCMKQYFHFVFYFIILQISPKNQHKILSKISETATGGLLYKKVFLNIM